MSARYYWLIVIFICMVLHCRFCVSCYVDCVIACLGCIGCLLSVLLKVLLKVHQVGYNFNFNLYKMHGEYNIKFN
jgi:hypothetical protein